MKDGESQHHYLLSFFLKSPIYLQVTFKRIYILSRLIPSVELLTLAILSGLIAFVWLETTQRSCLMLKIVLKELHYLVEIVNVGNNNLYQNGYGQCQQKSY